MARKLYEPQLTPEREVLAFKSTVLEEIRGKNIVRRIGEQYFMSCQCGTLDVTSNNTAPFVFLDDHEKCKGAENG